MQAKPSPFCSFPIIHPTLVSYSSMHTLPFSEQSPGLALHWFIPGLQDLSLAEHSQRSSDPHILQFPWCAQTFGIRQRFTKYWHLSIYSVRKGISTTWNEQIHMFSTHRVNNYIFVSLYRSNYVDCSKFNLSSSQFCGDQVHLSCSLKTWQIIVHN